jgi:hypothetical protein
MRILFPNEMALTIVMGLLEQRCSNYGYDGPAWRRITSQRKRAREAVRYALNHGGKPADMLLTAPLASRIDAKGHYVTGQSQNEEITNLLRQLVNPEARWLS